MSYELKALEFDKILEDVSKYTNWNKTKEYILNLSPITNIDEINNMQDMEKEAFNSIVKYDDIPILELKNIDEVLTRIEIGGVISLEEVLTFISLLNTTSNIKRYQTYLHNNKISIDKLDLYFNKITYNQRLKNDLTYKIDENGNIKDSASEGLFKVRRSLQTLNNRLHNKFNEFLSTKSSMLTETLIASRQGHLCLPFKVEYKNQVKGMILDESSSGTTVYIEPLECQMIEAEIENYKAQERREIEDILKGISLSINSCMEELKSDVEAIESLDIIYTKAKFAKENDYNFPKINDNGVINLINARHPLIDKRCVVPQTITLGDKYSAMIITGPNTGGKTVVLKTTGLLTVMALCGLAIPSKEGSEISTFDNVFVDIGDEQSIEQSLSTFSSHMKKIKNICDNVTLSSLVLIDEIGSGTDPKEGSSLAISIIDYIYKRGARIIATTHYSDLKEYAYSNKEIINASVEFDPETLKPTYKLLLGVAGMSNAISIAKNLGINDVIIDKALDIFKKGNSNTDNLISNLDIENQNIQKLKKEYEQLLNDYNKKMVDLELYKKKIEQERIKILKGAEEEAKDIIDSAKEDSEKLISEIDKFKKDKEAKEHELADIKFASRNLKAKGFNENLFDEELKVGDFVYIKSYDRTGQIIGINKKLYEVQVGQFKMSFNKSDLKLTKPPVEKKSQYKKPSGSTPAKYAKLELDLRGYRYEEVKDAIDIFIDKAFLANMSVVYIIHGFGTGAVRNAVQAYLKKSPYVKSYRYGGEGEGLNGVTVVTLK